MTRVEPKRSPFSNEPSVHTLTRFLLLNTLLWRKKIAKYRATTEIYFDIEK
jgi:hypothetical protein